MKLLVFPGLLIFLITHSSLQAYAQTSDVKFSLVAGSNGISLGKINGMTRDRNGVMWFSDQTNRCIVSYDGSKMVNYQNDIRQTNSLGGFYPECLATDSSGIIWIGFYGTGLDRFEPETNTFTHYRHDPKDPGSLGNDTVSAILVDHSGNLWIGNYAGVDFLDTKTGKFKHFRHTADPSSLSSRMVRALYEDHQGTIWVGTGFVWDNDSTDGGLNRFNREKGTFTRYMHDEANPNTLINNKVRAIFEDSKGNFWIGTKGDGLHSMNRETGMFERHLYDPARPDKLSRPPLKVPDDHITFITEDAKHNLWIGTFGNGLNRYDLNTNKLTHFGNNADGSGNFRDNTGWWASVSPDGLFWVATQESYLYKIDLFNNLIPKLPYVAGSASNFLYEDPGVAIWFGLGNERGLLRKDSKTGATQQFLNDPKNPNSISDNFVISIIKDKQNKLWVGTRSGLNHFDPQTKIFTRYLNVPGDSTSVNTNHIGLLCEDGNFLWIGGDAGLNLLDETTGKFTHYVNNPTDSTSLSNNSVNDLMKAGEHELWTGNWNNGGINRMNTVTGKCKRYIPGLSIGQLYKDLSGILWATTSRGLYRYDASADNFYLFSNTFDGIPVENPAAMVADNENNLWLTSPAGIVRINKERTQAVILGKESGVIGEEITYSWITRMNDGTIMIPGYRNDYNFRPENINVNPLVPKIFFSGFWLNGKETKSNGKSSLLQSPGLATQMDLGYDQRVFSVGFTSVDYSSSVEKKNFYKLENYDNDWRQANSENRVDYFNVPPGNYTFHIKAVNNSNGTVVEKMMTIHIASAWWSRWWAYCLYGVLAISLAILLYRYQRNYVLKAERERTREKELTQAKEIEKAYHELKTTQQQLVQAEKMASLGELTAGIAHEIQNPLNFVNNFSEVNRDMIGEMMEDLAQGKYEEVKAIALEIAGNEEKIIHHGNRASSIVKSMLLHSRQSSGNSELTDINELCDEYLRLSYHGLRAKDKSFNVDFKTDFDKSVGKLNVVPQDLGRVLLNFFNNAFYTVNEKQRTTVAYKPVVTLHTKRLPKQIEIIVQDNGNGIPPNVVSKIFQPFFTTKPAGSGTGLGLSLSFDIVKALGGEIKVDTKENEGTTFTIVLPVS